MFNSGFFGSAKISLIAFPWIGFFASVMYPDNFSLALNSVEEHHGSFSGIIVTGIIGGAIVPLIIGWLGDHLGLTQWHVVFVFNYGIYSKHWILGTAYYY